MWEGIDDPLFTANTLASLIVCYESIVDSKQYRRYVLVLRQGSVIGHTISIARILRNEKELQHPIRFAFYGHHCSDIL